MWGIGLCVCVLGGIEIDYVTKVGTGSLFNYIAQIQILQTYFIILIASMKIKKSLIHEKLYKLWSFVLLGLDWLNNKYTFLGKDIITYTNQIDVAF